MEEHCFVLFSVYLFGEQRVLKFSSRYKLISFLSSLLKFVRNSFCFLQIISSLHSSKPLFIFIHIVYWQLYTQTVTFYIKFWTVNRKFKIYFCKQQYHCNQISKLKQFDSIPKLSKPDKNIRTTEFNSWK